MEDWDREMPSFGLGSKCDGGTQALVFEGDGDVRTAFIKSCCVWQISEVDFHLYDKPNYLT